MQTKSGNPKKLMDEPKKRAGKGYVNLKKFGKLVGVSRQALTVFIRQGMPSVLQEVKGARPKRMVHLETGKEWISKNNKKIDGPLSPKFDSKGKTDAPKAVVQMNALLDPEWLHKDDIWSMARRLRYAEERALAKLNEAESTGQPNHIIHGCQRVYVDTVSEARKVYLLKDEIEAGMQEAWNGMLDCAVRWAEPIKSYLSAFPRSIAARANPGNPGLAESVIREAFLKELQPILTRVVTKE